MRTILTATATAILALLANTSIQAAPTGAEMHSIDASGVGTVIGTITASDSEKGLVLTPNLKGLAVGEHGFHLHDKGACGPGEKDGKAVAGLAAGGHFDPQDTGKHLGPDAEGHLGDLPQLTFASDGTSTTPVTAKRLKVKDLSGHALVIHAEPDNYGDKPGGARVACGAF